MVSKDEWKEIRRLLNRFIPVTLQADDYKLTIRLESCGDTRFFFAVYVNDEIKPEWTALSWEISDKFYNRHKHVNLSPKQKRYIMRHSSESEDFIERMTEKSYTPYWRSFGRLKNHLERKCSDLKYIGSHDDNADTEKPDNIPDSGRRNKKIGKEDRPKLHKSSTKLTAFIRVTWNRYKRSGNAIS